MTISSPSWMFCPPQLWAMKLMPSVVPRTNTMSSGESAPTNRATVVRAFS